MFLSTIRYSANLMTPGTFRVFDMPVYGPNVTISGLALRADLGPNSRQCGAFIPELSGEGVIAAKATFTGTVNGNILFVSRVTHTSVYFDSTGVSSTVMYTSTSHNLHSSGEVL